MIQISINSSNYKSTRYVLSILLIKDIVQEPFNCMIRELSCLAATALALAATNNETVRERFMDLGADEVIATYLKFHADEMGSDGAALKAACDAIQSLTMADDDQAFAFNVI